MSDLPYGRGGSPLQNLIIREHRKTMISAIQCVKEIDAGPVYLKKPLSLEGSAEEIFICANHIIEESSSNSDDEPSAKMLARQQTAQRLREQRQGLRKDQGKKDKNNGTKQKQSTDTILFVKNIDPDATVKELKDLFNKFGNVKNVDQLKRKPTQEKGTAYVGFNSPKSLERALDETKGTMMFKGQPINIEAAKASVQAAAQKKSGGNRGGRGRGGKNKDKNRRGTKGNNNDNKSFEEFGKKLSMHIAATNPLSVDENTLDKELIKKEKKIIEEELKSSGKPDNIIKKISHGRLTKFIEENTLLNQYWVMEPKKKVKEIIQDLNMDLVIIDFVRYKIGE